MKTPSFSKTTLIYQHFRFSLSKPIDAPGALDAPRGNSGEESQGEISESFQVESTTLRSVFATDVDPWIDGFPRALHAHECHGVLDVKRLVRKQEKDTLGQHDVF